MPALDFPASPTNGQVFGNWIYSTAKGAWQSKPLTPAKTVNSPTAPTSPADGDQWFNTNTGQLFIYYTDANGSQWVESRAPITADGYISPNYVINGGFDIWQRGTSFTTLTSYGADRWIHTLTSSSPSLNVTRVAGPVPSISYAARYLQATAQASVTEYAARQFMEQQHIQSLAGKTATLSFWYRSNKVGTHGARVSAETRATGGVNSLNAFTVATANVWTRYSITVDTFAGITAWTAGDTAWGAYIDIGFRVGASIGFTSLSANDYFEFSGVQLEEGSVATPFRRNANSIAGELAACQRYFYNPLHEISVLYSAFGNAVTYSANAARATIELPVTMRVVPTITGITVGDFWLGYGNIGNNFQATGMTIDPSTRNHLQITVNTSGGMNNNTFCQLYRPNATTVFPINAEL